MSHDEKKQELHSDLNGRLSSIGVMAPKRHLEEGETQAFMAIDTAAEHQRRPSLSITADSRPLTRFTFSKSRVFPLYTAEQRRRRDTTQWTLVQGILAPIQFLVFLVSLGLVLHFLWSGEGLAAATASVVIKTIALYTIMITGSIWEKVVFGRYLFARTFFWEDVFSMLVLALHTAYLAALFTGVLDARAQMLLALAAYAAYAINATQFILKLRAARLQGQVSGIGLAAVGGAS